MDFIVLPAASDCSNRASASDFAWLLLLAVAAQEMEIAGTMPVATKAKICNKASGARE